MVGHNEKPDNVIGLEQLKLGSITISSGNVATNATANVTITNVAPAGVTTATIKKWLYLFINGVDYWIPMWGA